MRDRGAVVIIQNNRLALIKRVRTDSIYYVFPGGGIEAGETPEAAAEREAWEELGVKVEIQQCLATVEFNGKQYFFQATIREGEFGTGIGEEFNDPKRGAYVPLWIELNELDHLDVKPRKVADIIQNRQKRNGN